MENLSNNVKKKLKKGAIIALVTLNTLGVSVSSASAAPPAGVDTTSYNSLVDIIFWVAGIAVAAAGGIPSVIKISQGQADEDPRGRNAGLAGLAITGACVAALIAIRTILF